jgi:hypothetical protein
MRRFNYTGRRKIPESDVGVHLTVSPTGVVSFTLRLNLKNVLPPLPAGCRLIVEAYDGPRFERFEFGEAQEEMLVSRELTGFAATNPPLFRLKLVEPADPRGRIAAHARAIRPTAGNEPQNARSLLHVTTRNLGQLVYRVELPEDGHEFPTLVINETLARPDDLGVRMLATHPVFVSMVMPQAVRDVLTHILFVERAEPEPDDESWRGKWISLAEQLAGDAVPNAEDNTAARAWIEAAAEGLARQLQAAERFKQEVAS